MIKGMPMGNQKEMKDKSKVKCFKSKTMRLTMMLNIKISTMIKIVEILHRYPN